MVVRSVGVCEKEEANLLLWSWWRNLCTLDKPDKELIEDRERENWKPQPENIIKLHIYLMNKNV